MRTEERGARAHTEERARECNVDVTRRHPIFSRGDLSRVERAERGARISNAQNDERTVRAYLVAARRGRVRAHHFVGTKMIRLENLAFFSEIYTEPIWTIFGARTAERAAVDAPFKARAHDANTTRKRAAQK